ncbi:excisionase family protein [Citrobacter freundii]|nr:excisionase family protein [Citrobacter freundii]
MSNVIMLVPNDWVTEKVLISVTGLKPGTITRARKESWLLGSGATHQTSALPLPGSRNRRNRA